MLTAQHITVVHAPQCGGFALCQCHFQVWPSYIVHEYSTSPPVCNLATLGLESHNPKHIVLILIQHSTYSLARASSFHTRNLHTALQSVHEHVHINLSWLNIILHILPTTHTWSWSLPTLSLLLLQSYCHTHCHLARMSMHAPPVTEVI